MGLFRKIFSKVWEYPGKFPEITPLFANRNFIQIQPGCLVTQKKNRPEVQLHEGGKVFLTLDRKLVARGPHG